MNAGNSEARFETPTALAKAGWQSRIGVCMPSLMHFRCQLGNRRTKTFQTIIQQWFANAFSPPNKAGNNGSSATDFRQCVETSPIFDILPASLMLLRQIELRC